MFTKSHKNDKESSSECVVCCCPARFPKDRLMISGLESCLPTLVGAELGEFVFFRKLVCLRLLKVLL